MNKSFLLKSGFGVLVPASLLAFGLCAKPAQAQNRMYNPIAIPNSNEVNDTLSEQDIPTGQGGFARDYTVTLNQGDYIAIDVTSESFDTIVSLISPSGITIAENDDGPDGTTNSLLFSRMSESGRYIIRVRAFGETGTGGFFLKLTRLRPI